MPKYAARDAARLHIWTAAPAPLRLFLPQAAPQLRSQRRLPVSSTGRGRRCCPCSASLYLPQAALGCAARRPLDVPQPCGLAPIWGSGPFNVPLSGSFAGTVRQSFASAVQPVPRRSSLWFIPPEGGCRAAAGGTPIKGRWAGIDQKINIIPSALPKKQNIKRHPACLFRQTGCLVQLLVSSARAEPFPGLADNYLYSSTRRVRCS